MFQNGTLSYLGIAIVAGAVGAAIGMLVAPASGAETRRRMLRRLEDEEHALLRKSQRAAERAADYVHEHLEVGKRRLAEVGRR